LSFLFLFAFAAAFLVTGVSPIAERPCPIFLVIKFVAVSGGGMVEAGKEIDCDLPELSKYRI